MKQNNMIPLFFPEISSNLFATQFKHLLITLLITIPLSPQLYAQDAMPKQLSADKNLFITDTLILRWQYNEQIAEPFVRMPDCFRAMKENEIIDSVGILNPFWDKLRWLRFAATDSLRTDSLRVIHIGDSHIRGHIFPRTVGELMKQSFRVISHEDFGINGAFCVTFNKPENIRRVAALKPDLLILSFGTNEAHNVRYISTLHYQQMDELVRELRAVLPEVPMLITTPPGQYEGIGRRHRRRPRSYRVNPRTALAARTIRRFADEQGLALWDMYEICGGQQRAALNWWDAGLMRPDHIHYMPEGYTLQGELLHQALVKKYNEFVGI